MHTTKKSVAIALLCFSSFAPLAAQEAQIDSLIALGKAHLEAGTQDKAITALNEAVSLVPDRIQTYLTVGDTYLNAGHLNQAMKAYQEALALNDASPEAQTGIAEVHYRKASGGITSIYHARKAVSTARRATRLNPDYAPAYITLGRAYIRLNENYTAAAGPLSLRSNANPTTPKSPTFWGMPISNWPAMQTAPSATPEWYWTQPPSNAWNAIWKLPVSCP